jgi:RND superfamily putative drug exporter
MDYHVFLLSRIRERYEATGDNRRAVSEALASSATPITSAALIMVAVFLSFVSAGEPSVQQLGVAAAVAIAIDATLVRLVIVPAAMELLGDWNWWLPRPLARILPPVGSPRPAADRGDAYLPLPAASGGPR